MRKIISTVDSKVTVYCDDLELYGRDVTIQQICGKCSIYHKFRGRNDYNLHCYGPQKLNEMRIEELMKAR
jgi:hypothetical protein